MKIFSEVDEEFAWLQESGIHLASRNESLALETA
jgi:hypothetical protein